MRRKIPAEPLVRTPREDRTLVPAARRCALPTVRTLLALGASMLAGGALTLACKGKEDVSSDPGRSTAATSSSSGAASVASASPSAGLADLDTPPVPTAAPSAPPSSSAVAAVSCSASAHVMPHILPSKDNHQLGGKPAPVKCPPGDPLCTD